MQGERVLIGTVFEGILQKESGVQTLRRCHARHTVTRYSRQDVIRILHLHARQLSAWERAGLITSSEHYSFEALRQSCIDVRTLVAWLRAQGYTEVGVIGASLGGAIAMTLACAPPIPDFIVPIIGHLQLADVVENAPIFWRMKADLERFGLGVGRRREIFDQFRASGPAPLVPRERQLWIMARDDQYMSAEAVLRQWHEWGEPPIEWIDGGHMTLALHLPLVIALVRNFYRGLGAASP